MLCVTSGASDGGLKILTYFSYAVLGIMTLFHSKSLFIITAPTIAFGFLFSGIPYNGGTTSAWGHLYAVVSLIILTFILSQKKYYKYIHLFMFTVGMGSSFLYFMDGHPILIVTLALMLTWFGDKRKWNSVRKRVNHITSLMLLYTFGFLVSMISNQVIKSAYLGASIFNIFFNQLSYNYSFCFCPYHPSIFTVFSDIISYWKSTGMLYFNSLFPVVRLGSLLTFSVSIFLAIRLYFLRKNLSGIYGIIIFFILILVSLSRHIIFMNHSLMHLHFMGRWMFLPYALCYSCFLYSLILWKSSRKVESKNA